VSLQRNWMSESGPWGILLGAVAGFLFAWALEATHHSALGILLLLAASVLPGLFLLLPAGQEQNPVRELLIWCYIQPAHVRAGLVLLLIGINILIEYASGRNPITYAYVPLLPAVIASGVLFGPASGLFAVLASIVAADLLFSASDTNFSMSEWGSIALLGSFAVLGSMLAYAFSIFLRLAQEEVENSELWPDRP
jgi:hypothetical protein